MSARARCPDCGWARWFDRPGQARRAARSHACPPRMVAGGTGSGKSRPDELLVAGWYAQRAPVDGTEGVGS